jgi:large subunit ribosomal protein L15
MNLNDVHHGIQKNKSRKRVGRGPGSGHGKTSGRGHKGQGSRSGSSVSPIFEGGQMPLVRRIPKRGFNNRWAETVAAINVAELEKHFQDGEEVSPEVLLGKRLVHRDFDMLKVLGNGELTKKLTISAHKFSRQAVEKIEKAGGQVVVLPGKKPVVKNKMRAKTRK